MERIPIKFIIIFSSLFSVKVLTKVNPSDVELIFRLRDYFKSDLILIAKNEDNNFVKSFYKFQDFSKFSFVGSVEISQEFKFPTRYVSSYKNPLIVLDFCTNFMKIKNVSTDLITSFIWISFIQGNISEILNDFYIPFNSKFFFVKRINEDNLEIMDVYQISQNSPKIFSRFAVWDNGEFIHSAGNFFDKRMDLKGFQLNIARSHFKEFAETYGYLWRLFSEKMNFSLNLISTGRKDYFYSNGTKTGLFKLLHERRIDGSPSNMVYNEKRLQVYDYIFPTMVAETRIYVKLNTKINWTTYVAPFKIDVWASIFLWITIASIINHTIIKCLRKNSNIRFGATIFNVLKALCYEEATFSSRITPLCISYLMTYILGLILIQYYSGALSSYLTVEQINLPFKDLKELVMDGSYKISVLDRSYALFFFNTDPGFEATTIRAKNLMVAADKLPETTGTGFRQLCDYQWVFLSPSYGLTIKEKCDILELDDVIFREWLGIMVWKGFPYKDVMNKLMARIKFAGLVKSKYKNKIIPYDKSGVFKPLSITLVFPIFVFFLIVVLLSVIILFFERK